MSLPVNPGGPVPPHSYSAPQPVAQGAQQDAYFANAGNQGPQGPGCAYGAPRKKSKAPLVITIVLLIVALLCIGGCTLGAASSPLTKKVGVIQMVGTIGTGSGATTPEGLMSQLAKAEADDSIAAVVLRVDSGGGVSAAGEEMAEYVKDFSKPVVVSTASSNASAAYLISSQADWLMVNKSSSVGAIGTILQVVDYSKLMEMLGIEMTNIASSTSKDSSYGTRPLTAEEIAYYQNMVDEINENFVSSVAEGRNMSIEEVRALATGLPFTGSESIENGLFDEVGTFSDACAKAAELGGIAKSSFPGAGASYAIVSLEDEESDLSALMDLLASSKQSTTLEETLSEGLSSNGTNL